MSQPDAIVIGAGPAGLACAATMRREGLAVTLLEKADTVGSVWRHFYDGMHLHSDRGHSALPGLPMPRAWPRYPSRHQVVDYLERYAEHFALAPRFGTQVQGVRADPAGWQVQTDARALVAPAVVVATGWAGFPHLPHWPEMERYRGRLLHSSGYRNAAALKARRVLVVGLGNSGGDIALELAMGGVEVTLSVRGPVQVIPQELLGLPIIGWAIAQAWLPAGLADIINAPAIRLAVGPLGGSGLVKAAKGPRRMIEEDGRVPLIDVGTVARIRDGSIRVRPGIAHFAAEGVVFVGATEVAPFDAVVLATGFRPDLNGLLREPQAACGGRLLDARGMPFVSGRATAARGLYFCGLIASPTGQLREIGIEAQRIARLVLNSVRAGRVT